MIGRTQFDQSFFNGRSWGVAAVYSGVSTTIPNMSAKIIKINIFMLREEEVCFMPYLQIRKETID